ILGALGLSSIHAAAPRAGGGVGSSGSGGLGAAGTLGPYRGEWDGRAVTTPYPVTSPFDRQRALAAALSDTVYVYDFIELLERALEHEWSRYKRQRGLAIPVRRPRQCLTAVELVLQPKRRGADGSEAALSTASMSGASPTAGSSSGGGAIGGSGGAGAEGTCGGHAASANPDDWELCEVRRAAGLNDIGMVAWRLTMYTPQYPEEMGGRELIVIANDITFRAGSFGTLEDVLFLHASTYARERGIPRVYLAANSGARIGLSEEVKKLFRVAWQDPAHPAKGYKYLYLTAAEYAALAGDAAWSASALPPAGAPPADANLDGGRPGGAAPGTPRDVIVLTPPSASAACAPVLVRRVVDEGEERFVLTDIIGREPDLGVENLRGSGAIAGETARAYVQAFTLTYVTGRSVGIGAYLVRLGHRTIQKSGSAPIILTGYEALNKLMGSDVYSSNLQLGGPKIMYHNGVSHETVDNDFEGVSAMLRWLAFLPRTRGAPLPVMDVARGDEVDRDVEFDIPTDGHVGGCRGPPH
ncbi:hypothetical protein EON68_01630, partial [archaeon]